MKMMLLGKPWKEPDLARRYQIPDSARRTRSTVMFLMQQAVRMMVLQQLRSVERPEGMTHPCYPMRRRRHRYRQHILRQDGLHLCLRLRWQNSLGTWHRRTLEGLRVSRELRRLGGFLGSGSLCSGMRQWFLRADQELRPLWCKRQCGHQAGQGTQPGVMVNCSIAHRLDAFVKWQLRHHFYMGKLQLEQLGRILRGPIRGSSWKLRFGSKWNKQ